MRLMAHNVAMGSLALRRIYDTFLEVIDVIDVKAVRCVTFFSFFLVFKRIGDRLGGYDVRCCLQGECRKPG